LDSFHLYRATLRAHVI